MVREKLVEGSGPEQVSLAAVAACNEAVEMAIVMDVKFRSEQRDAPEAGLRVTATYGPNFLLGLRLVWRTW